MEEMHDCFSTNKITEHVWHCISTMRCFEVIIKLVGTHMTTIIADVFAGVINDDISYLIIETLHSCSRARFIKYSIMIVTGGIVAVSWFTV